ncbi:MAG: hypothetical protein JJU22_03025 [Gammaproteobacteria bacterium]|nr:hypothetical protein [Gammaproteobacteria bacterium]
MRKVTMPVLTAALVLAACGGPPPPAALPEQPASGPVSDGWLGSLDSHGDRFRALEGYLGGFSSAMWEVGERYRHLHQALLDDNHELAAYHWAKVGDAIRSGYLKRPARQANADALFLDTVFEPVAEALALADPSAAWPAFEQARAACIACHAAEDVAFMNDQPMLRDLRAP